MIERVGGSHASRRGTLEPVLAILDALPRGHALDAPSGGGVVAGAMREMGFEVSAADLDPDVFELAEEIDFRPTDLEQPLPFEDGRFVLIHCGDGIEHFENPFFVIREFARTLAPGGTLVVSTPNYLSIRRRLKFLYRGSLETPIPRAPGYGRGPRYDRGHINPLTLIRLAYMAENADLELVQVEVTSHRRRHALMTLPLAFAIWLSGRLRPPKEQEALFHPWSTSFRILVGGRKLIAVFRKAVPGGAPS